MDQVHDQTSETTGTDVTVKQLGPHAGAEIYGIDTGNPVDDAARQTIYDALMDNGVILFRNQDITREQQADFAANFGELTVHPFSPHLDDLPEMIVLDNDGSNPPLSTDVWHSDEMFRLEPPLGTLLRAKIVPRLGGDTLFSSMTAAFEGLSDQMQSFVSGLEAVNDFKNFKRLYGSSPEHRQRLWEMMDKFPNPVHPVVRIHPVTGKKAIYVCPQFTVAIKGMKPDESEALLNMLYRQAHVPEYQFRVHWQENLMAFWDNRTVQHYAARDYLPDRRRMERITLKGDLPYGDLGKSYSILDPDAERADPILESYQTAGETRSI
jgi:taurine dioxygenase